MVSRLASLLDLAVDPHDRRRVLATGGSNLGSGLYESRDGGETRERVSASLGRLAWPAHDRLCLTDANGDVLVSADGGRRFEARGSTGDVAAFLGTSAAELYVALYDGTIKRSLDGGRTRTIRSAP
ncbi:MAG: hypothetical protein KatS3mg012_1321 [Gaiellaceae bacterium]|nr:MAG: hypothetical protein KatS3mg012_1321 [Gaiellaceae bacterium]